MPDGGRIPTNLRTLMILEILGQGNRAMTATEINAQLGLPKQTVHRLCATLERDGFIARQGKSKRFYPARRLRLLGAGLLHSARTHIIRHQILMDVAASVRETVNFVVPADDGMSYLDRVETDWAFRIQLPVGSHVPFHCTASGKTFLASLPTPSRETFVRNIALDAHTDATLTDPGKLLDELHQIAERGYALDEEEFMQGMVAIAVPVMDTESRFLAALAFHGPTQRVSRDSAVARLDVLQQAASQLSHAILLDD
ncbi:MAG: IclR family transcriptional regulator [Pseudomonadota bacterium]